jgi:hypothetical protein
MRENQSRHDRYYSGFFIFNKYVNQLYSKKKFIKGNTSIAGALIKKHYLLAKRNE